MKRFLLTSPAFLFFCVLMLTIAQGARAQNSLIIDVSPTYPSPGENFSITAQSFVFDVARANFRWYENGKLVASGVGKRINNFVAPSLGKSLVVRISATNSEGLVFEESVTIAPIDIDFIVSAQTYVPSFYRGAPILTPGSRVNIFAIPHVSAGGSKLNFENLIYDWELDEKKIFEQSGRGQNRLSFRTPDYQDVQNEVVLRVFSSGGPALAEKSISISTRLPFIAFYPFSALVGITKVAQKTFETNAGGRVGVLAEPYFFDTETVRRGLFSWKEGSATVSAQAANPRYLELQAPPEGNFQTRLSLELKDPQKLFQQAISSFTLKVNGSEN